MKIINSEKRLCTCCMEEHEVKTVRVMEHTNFKNVDVNFEATYFYCDLAEELYMDEMQMQANNIAMKEAYRRIQGLLTAKAIKAIRLKYNISQKDFSILLGWGEKTITRYETYQIQDKAHDSILKKIEVDPEWFLCLLENSKDSLSMEAYKKYLNVAASIYENNQDLYLRKAIEAKYIQFQNNSILNGNTALSLDKVVDVIRYMAASESITNLYKVKLMKLMWYSDVFAYKKRGEAITGLVYRALPMGAVPIGHDSIINLKNVPCEEVDMGETTAYHFSLKGEVKVSFLTEEEKDILDYVIKKIGKTSKNEIVDFMHKEKAYIETRPKEIISFEYAESLQI